MDLHAHMEDLTNALVSCGNLLVREAARIFRPHGITPAQFNVLNLLRINGEGMRPSEIAEHLVVDPASTTYLMKQVEERGWILRVHDQEDKRAHRVELTQEGRQKVSEVLPIYQAALAETARQLGERPHIEELFNLLRELPVAAIRTTENLAMAASLSKRKALSAGGAKEASESNCAPKKGRAKKA